MPKFIADHCKVCGSQNACGTHFDVLCCKACAVFFRRHATTTRSLSCRSPASCEEKLCKSCRLRRCYEMGMNTEKFQHNRDPISAVQKSPPRSFSHFVGRPNLVLFCIPSDSRPSKTYISLHSLIEKATRILEHGLETPITGRSQLHNLCIAFQSFTPTPCEDPGPVVSAGKSEEERSYETMLVITKEKLAMFWEYYMCRIAKWLTHFDEFRKIPKAMQVKLLMTIWHVWGRLDKLIATAKRRRIEKPKKGEQVWTMSNGTQVDVDRTKADLSWLSRYPLHQIFYFLQGIGNWDLVPEIEKIMELELTDIEFNYMLAQLIFSYAGKRHQGDILKICERFQELLANDLHNYYLEEKRLPNYSGRLSQMMKVNNSLQNDIRKSHELSNLAAVFNVFHVEFSHPEMFKDTGYQ